MKEEKGKEEERRGRGDEEEEGASREGSLFPSWKLMVFFKTLTQGSPGKEKAWVLLHA